MTTKKKKSAREKRVLIASLIVAGVIAAGSTFAWFTSKDEVTNRLSASANYGVSIAEDFTPPDDWVPGQTVDKKVGVVNTGNVDAFVRVWLEGEMRLLAQGNSEVDANTASTSLTTNAVNDANLKELGFTYSTTVSGATVYLKELDNTKKIANPDTQNQNSPPAYTEVMAVQAGGELAYCPTPNTGASYKFTPNQAMSVTNSAGAIQQLAEGQEYSVTIDSSATNDNDIVVDNTAHTITLNSLAAFRNIDSNTFVPIADGLYIFKRNADLGTTTGDDFEFSGYYVKTIGEGAEAKQHFFALEYDIAAAQRSSNVLSDSNTANSYITYTIANDGSYTVDTAHVKLFAAKQETIANSGLTWNLVKGVTKDGVIYTTDGTTWYKGSTALNAQNDVDLITALNALNKVDMFQVKRTSGAGAGVLIDIALDNIASGDGNAEKWTAITATGKPTTFYYNNDLEEGATTSKLVDSVTMDSSVTQNDYITFDFDLNVLMESVQVTLDNNGDEGFTTVNSWAATGTSNIAATGEKGSVDSGEITLIKWTVVPTT